MRYVFFLLWTALMVITGYRAGELQSQELLTTKTAHLQDCFDTCASLLLLTPDDPEVYGQRMKTVNECAEE